MADVMGDLPLTTPLFVEAPTGDEPIAYSAFDFRHLTAAIWTGHNAVLHPMSFRVSQAPIVGWTVVVQGGWATIGAGSGVMDKYLVTAARDTAVSLASFNTSPPGVRTHAIWLAVYDELYAGGSTVAQIVATEDTTGAGAPAPVDARYAMKLATVMISPGQHNIQNANIADLRVKTPHTHPYSDALTLATGYTDAYADTNMSPIQVNFRQGTVKLTGSVRRTSGDAFAAGTNYTIGSISGYGDEYAPRDYKTFLCATSGNNESGDDAYAWYVARVWVFSSGDVRIDMPEGNSAVYVYLDGVSYDL